MASFSFFSTSTRSLGRALSTEMVSVAHYLPASHRFLSKIAFRSSGTSISTSFISGYRGEVIARKSPNLWKRFESGVAGYKPPIQYVYEDASTPFFFF